MIICDFCEKTDPAAGQNLKKVRYQLIDANASGQGAIDTNIWDVCPKCLEKLKLAIKASFPAVKTAIKENK